jgi:hypothetical protein
VKDFRRNLSKAEKKKLITSGDFAIHFYLTKRGLISDPSFTPPDLPQEIKKIVLKGLAEVTNWRPAEISGRAADVEFTLDKRTLMNN